MYPGAYGSFGPYGSRPYSSGYGFPSYASPWGGNVSPWGANSLSTPFSSFPLTSYGGNFSGLSPFRPATFSTQSYTPSFPSQSFSAPISSFPATLPSFPTSSCSSCAPSSNYVPPVSSFVPPVSSFAPASPYIPPVSSYVPPASSFIPQLSSFTPPAFTPPAFTPATMPISTPYVAPYAAAPAPYSTPYASQPTIGNFASAYGSYTPPAFDARSYGSYTPYSPYSSFSAPQVCTPFSAYGGYRGLEQPLTTPTLALPAPSGFPTSFESLPVPTFQPALTGFGSFPLPTATAIPATGTETGAPVDAAEGEQARAEEKEEEEEDVLEGEPFAAEQKTPWAPQGNDEEFDLEYSRQVASRRVIGEEDE